VRVLDEMLFVVVRGHWKIPRVSRITVRLKADTTQITGPPKGGITVRL